MLRHRLAGALLLAACLVVSQAQTVRLGGSGHMRAYHRGPSSQRRLVAVAACP